MSCLLPEVWKSSTMSIVADLFHQMVSVIEDCACEKSLSNSLPSFLLIWNWDDIINCQVLHEVTQRNTFPEWILLFSNNEWMNDWLDSKNWSYKFVCFQILKKKSICDANFKKPIDPILKIKAFAWSPKLIVLIQWLVT
jgi:hypothetical protein